MLSNYIVVCKCGHVGRGYYMPIAFPVFAESAKEAAAKARAYARVKHNHKDAVLEVRKVSFEEYFVQKEINDADPYLHCNSRYQQRAFFDKISDRLMPETRGIRPLYFDRKERVRYRLMKEGRHYEAV